MKIINQLKTITILSLLFAVLALADLILLLLKIYGAL